MKKLTQAAQAAKLIRQDLKSAFPRIKFAVRSQNYSMGNNVRVHWDNGPTEDAVYNIIKKYQSGHFDGMTDCYEYSNSHDDIPQAKFISSHRKITEEIYAQAFLIGKSYFASFENVNNLDDYNREIGCTSRNFLWRILDKIDLSDGLTKEKFRKACNPAVTETVRRILSRSGPAGSGPGRREGRGGVK